MLLKPLEKLDAAFQNPTVAEYWEKLNRRKWQLFGKRLLDICGSAALILLLSPAMLVIYILVVTTSKGPGFFLQERVGRYGKPFRILKFRTMVVDAEALGAQVTGAKDPRITKIGHMLRKFRLDEFPQVFQIFIGTMSFVGTRPEVPRYVAHYSEEMMATLLLAPGLTSRTSIEYKDESRLLGQAEDPDRIYIEQIMPAKMTINLRYFDQVSPFYDIGLLFHTLSAVIFK